MSSTIGNRIRLTLSGESHGKFMMATLDGLASGIEVDRDYIDKILLERRPKSNASSARREADEYEIISGVFNGFTTGAALTILMKNSDVDSSSYEKIKDLARPSQADYPAFIKYKGFNDYRGSGIFSARLTAPVCAAAAIILKELEKKGITFETHLKRVGKIIDEARGEEFLSKTYHMYKYSDDEIEKYLDEIKNENDSVGAEAELIIKGVKAGLGEPPFAPLDGELARYMYLIPSVKSVSFGNGDDFAQSLGSEVADEMRVEDDKVKFLKNTNGGIIGGISNGADIVLSCVFKPIASIPREFKTINMKTMENAEININGRHDASVVPRVYPIMKCYAALAIYDMLVSA
ncbi:chorismate synthase [Fenollaria massiliensis]|uniref:Chorismate synthase n=1 Tax=Fenollaria massiliensis TaxID=938288 RepID=A0A9E7ITV7_9FIRM|nr:chorismate synthase [Fenollaria massiliensis]UQK58747.1 chorismate synthase [Fenollaria massiliensis]